VLVNNKAFQPALNDQLVMRFLDLKNGARVVSLKNFVPVNERRSSTQQKKHREHDPRSLLKGVKVLEYGSGCVSWTDQGGEYYVVTKQSRE
jgi:H3 lysine-79-specific histone-lysine N-methyltransferase